MFISTSPALVVTFRACVWTTFYFCLPFSNFFLSAILSMTTEYLVVEKFAFFHFLFSKTKLVYNIQDTCLIQRTLISSGDSLNAMQSTRTHKCEYYEIKYVYYSQLSGRQDENALSTTTTTNGENCPANLVCIVVVANEVEIWNEFKGNRKIRSDINIHG